VNRNYNLPQFATSSAKKTISLSLTSRTKGPANAMKVKPIPEGYHAITPYLMIKGASQAIEFYAKAFGAKEVFRMSMPDGRVGHAEIQIGDSRLMLADEFPEMGFLGPQSRGGSTVSILLYVDNVDEVFAQAISAGATAFRNVQNQFYGDRSGSLTDPFGHQWTIATHVEDVSEEEMKRRLASKG
jgi:PhnB protein